VKDPTTPEWRCYNTLGSIFKHHVSNSCCFSNINISQGSVARRLRHGWIFYYSFNANLLLSLLVKEFENRSVFGKVRGKKYSGTFLPDTVNILL